MNKAELTDAVAARSGLSRKDAAAVVDALLRTVEEELGAGGRVAVTGFGSFEAKRRPERPGRNPATNEAITLPADRVPVFRPGRALRDALNED